MKATIEIINPNNYLKNVNKDKSITFVYSNQ